MKAELWDRIEKARRRWNVLEHPFYVRWSAGELSREELARYAGQYRHAVEAIAEMSAAVASALPERPDLSHHASEEADHVGLWDGFVAAVGGDTAAEAGAETQECVGVWRGEGEPLATAARLYAIESGQPEISRVKREGLRVHYGVTEGPGTAYFEVHERRDRDHAREGRRLIDELAAAGDVDRIAATAESAFRANWLLLDGVR